MINKYYVADAQNDESVYVYYTINLWLIYIYLDHRYSRWVRLFGSWYGVCWKNKNTTMLFSERMGYTKTWVIGNYRFNILKPIRFK